MFSKPFGTLSEPERDIREMFSNEQNQPPDWVSAPLSRSCRPYRAVSLPQNHPAFRRRTHTSTTDGVVNLEEASGMSTVGRTGRKQRTDFG